MENLIDELTAKNRDYIHSVTKQLMLAGKSDDDIKGILNEILPQIIEGQKKGLLAKKTFGTPSEFVATQVDAKSEKSQVVKEYNEKMGWMWLDSALLFFGFILVLSGVLGIFSPQSRIYGLTMAVVMSILAGLVMYLVYYNFYSRVGTKRKWSLKGIIAVVIAAVLWLFLTMAAGMLPAALNPQLNPYVSLVIGVLALLLKYFLRKKFNIRSAMAPVATSQQAQKK